MAIYAIGDLHLSVNGEKPMDIFTGWEGYQQRLETGWRSLVDKDDTVVLAGDTSWGMSLEQARDDFAFIDALPGKKLLLKGNHDYWWTSASKMAAFFAENGFSTLSILHNNSVQAEGLQLCGSRGWLFENGQPHDEKIIRREGMRIEASLRAATGAGERVLFLHYPPVYAGQVQEPYIELMLQYGIKRCYYGHIHGAGHRHAFQGDFRGVRLTMVSSDYLRFVPLLVQK